MELEGEEWGSMWQGGMRKGEEMRGPRGWRGRRGIARIKAKRNTRVREEGMNSRIRGEEETSQRRKRKKGVKEEWTGMRGTN